MNSFTYARADDVAGAVWGLYALECAMDEFAFKAGIDPIQLRPKNYTEKDHIEDKPFSSKELRACYRLGAERFGWPRRNPEPRSMRQGNTLIGWGMATGIWDAFYVTADAKAVSTADSKLTVSSATEDIEVIFVQEQDEVVNPLGVKGLGEIGIVGVAAAIANAVFHATGKRIRDLPITLDNLM
jgi:CO/xanthine dehydrogenase Mo-binding subunit